MSALIASTPASDGRLRRGGFTLVETILVIALIGVLIALALPSLSRVRGKAMEDKSLTNCRSHAQVLTTYSSDFKDTWPYLTSPMATSSVIRCDSRNESFEAMYFDAYIAWNIGLADGYYDGKFDDLSFTTPWTNAAWGLTEYQFPCVFLADPKFYNAETEENPPLQLRATHGAEVTFPSSKSLIVAQIDDPTAMRSIGTSETRFHIACVDGHGTAINRSRLVRSFGGDGAASPTMSIHMGSLSAGPLHTLDGVAGRDLAN